MVSGDSPEKSSSQQPEIAEPLAEREMEILRLLADGWTDRKIGSITILHPSLAHR